jgi:hypothetical protein
MQVAPRVEQAGASPLQQGPLSAPQALHEPLLHTLPTAEHVPASPAPPGQQVSFNRPQVMPVHMPFWHVLSGPGQLSEPWPELGQQACPG